MIYTIKNGCVAAELIRLHKMVTEVKTDREVGLAYMKAFEIEKHSLSEFQEAKSGFGSEKYLEKREESARTIVG